MGEEKGLTIPIGDIKCGRISALPPMTRRSKTETAGGAGSRGNTMSHFRPTREPARSIHDALVREASKRNKRMPEEWLQAERQAVLQEAIAQASLLGLRPPSLVDVERAERLAMGHTDYAAKFARGIADAMAS